MSHTASRLKLSCSAVKSSGPCYLSKKNNKPWWLRNIGITRSDPERPLLELICHLCISHRRWRAAVRSRAAVPVWRRVRRGEASLMHSGTLQGRRSGPRAPRAMATVCCLLVFLCPVAALTQTRPSFYPLCHCVRAVWSCSSSSQSLHDQASLL